MKVGGSHEGDCYYCIYCVSTPEHNSAQLIILRLRLAVPERGGEKSRTTARTNRGTDSETPKAVATGELAWAVFRGGIMRTFLQRQRCPITNLQRRCISQESTRTAHCSKSWEQVVSIPAHPSKGRVADCQSQPPPQSGLLQCLPKDPSQGRCSGLGKVDGRPRYNHSACPLQRTEQNQGALGSQELGKRGARQCYTHPPCRCQLPPPKTPFSEGRARDHACFCSSLSTRSGMNKADLCSALTLQEACPLPALTEG